MVAIVTLQPKYPNTVTSEWIRLTSKNKERTDKEEYYKQEGDEDKGCC